MSADDDSQRGRSGKTQKPRDGFLFHAVYRGEAEFFEPLRGAAKVPTATVSNAAWRADGQAFVVAITGLHATTQRDRLRDVWQQPPTRGSRRKGVAMVELCTQWVADYLHSHGGHCLETLGWATHIVAPDPIATKLRTGILASPGRYAEYLRDVQSDLRERRETKTPRYRACEPPTAAVAARTADIARLIAHLESPRCTWDGDRIIDSGLPPLVTPFFDGTQLRRPEAERVHEDSRPRVAWIDQSHDPGVRLAVERAADATFMVESFERIEGEDDASRVERGRALLFGASIIVTEFSNLAYQAALHGKRVLYCTWRARTRPLPLLLKDLGDGRFKVQVREARREADVATAIADAANGGWPEGQPVATTSPAEIVRRIRTAATTPSTTG